MNEIICPHCDKAFKIDEAGYADIMKQVRDHQFEKEIHERLERAQEDKNNALQLVKQEAASAVQTIQAAKDLEIERLKSQLREKETSIDSTVMKAINKVEKERDNLKAKLENAHLEKQNAENALKEKYETQIEDRDQAIERLKDLLSTKS